MKLDTVKKFLWITFVLNLGRALVRVPLTLFFLGKGLDLFQVNMLVVVLYTVLLLFELPTGWFADRVSRKRSVVISCVFFGLAFFGYAFAGSFWQCMAAAFMEALGSAFMHGAFHAWLYDQLAVEGRQELQKKSYAWEEQMIYGTTIIGSLVGPRLYLVNNALPWIVSGFIFFGLSVFAAIVIRENYRRPATKLNVFSGLAQARGSRDLRYVFFLCFLQFFATVAPDYQWQPFFKGLGLDEIGLGYLLAGCFAMGFAGSKIIEKLNFSDATLPKLLFAFQIVLGVGLIASVSTPLLAVAIPMLLMQEVARGMFNPAQSFYLQRSIKDSHQRATIGSLGSMAGQMGAIAGLLASGFLASYFTIPVSWKVAGFVIIAGTFIVYEYFRKKQIGS